MKTKTALIFVTIACLGCIASTAVAQYGSDPFAEQLPPVVRELRPVIQEVRPMAVASPQGAVTSSTAIPADAREIAAHYDAEKTKVRREARKQIRKLRQTLAASLETLQTRYAHEAKLDEAVAIRDCIRGLGGLQPMPDPGMLFAYSNSVGRSLFFRVTGDRKKSIWGANPYTPDSGLSSAAVHAGVLKVGQAGVVKVTILPGQSSYPGSSKNGITSSRWGNSPISYLVEPVTEKDEDAAEMPATMSPVPSPAMSYPARTYYYGGNGGYSSAPSTGWIAAPAIAYSVRPVTVAPAAKLPDDAQRLVDDFQAGSAAINRAANRKIAEMRQNAVDNLKPLQDKYTRETRLDEAVAIRNYIRDIGQPIENVLPDPGSLNPFSAAIGGVYYFRVTGQRNGPTWGADVYTADSALATTAVHAGVLREGQTGVVKVTILPGQASYQGVFRNGIGSSDFGAYPSSYRVESADVDETVAVSGGRSRRTRTPASASARVATNPQGDKTSARQVDDLRREVARLESSLREVMKQLTLIREEEQMLKKQPPAR